MAARGPLSNKINDELHFIVILLGQWLNFNFFEITYLVGKIKFKLFFSGSRTAE